MLIPDWLAKYQRQNLGSDLAAGVVVAILVLPQSLAYALLAGLPPQAGLYASIFPVLMYAWFGSSMRQAVGPVAITSIMTFSVLSPLASPGSTEYLTLAAMLALFSGLLTLAFGLVRLGFLSQLLSRPVISGFISGSALLIVLSQLRPLLGLPKSGAGAELHWITLLLGGGSVLVLLACRYSLVPLARRFGFRESSAQTLLRVMPLALLMLATVLVIELRLDVPGQAGGTAGVAVVGPVAAGAGLFQWQPWNLQLIPELLTPALILAFVGALQNITMAQALAARSGQRIEFNRELTGLGAANVMAAFSGGMPVGGGLSRSALNVMAGAVTPLASMATACTTLLIVLSGTRWLEHLPLTVLAANIVVAAISMIDVAAFRKAWAYDRADALALLGTALGVLLAGIQVGIALGIGFSLVTLLVRASAPHIAVIGRIAGTEHFRNVERHGTETLPWALFLRIDESLFFGNLNAVESRIWTELARAPAVTELVLIMSAVNRVDATAMEVLTDLNRELQQRGLRLHLAEIKGPVQDRLQHSALWSELSGSVYQSVNAAFEALASGVHAPEFHI